MSKKSFSPLPEIFLSDTKIADGVYRMRKRGRVRNIVGKLYTSNMEDSIDNIASRRLWEIIGLLFPGAVIADRTAITLKPTSNGELFIVSSKTRAVSFGPFTVYPRKGTASIEGDMPFMRNLFLMSEPRKFLENMRHARKGKASVPRFLSCAEMEEKLDAYIRHNGEEAFNNLRDKMRGIADVLGLRTEFTAFANLASGLLGTKEAKLTTRAAIARGAGNAFDPDRVILFSKLYEALALRPPLLRKVENDANEILCFYEAYFSNYIEGTTFTVDEAAEIIFEHKIPEKRPEDAHDIAGTYNVISSAAEMKKTPGDFDSFLSILKERHVKIMSGRPNTMPGKFKEKPNQAGSALFVQPGLVYGTLSEGFGFYQRLETAFAKAVFMMFMLTETHPFSDGNGRIARIMMNAELSSAGEQRIIIPTVYRDNYVDALRGLSHNGVTEPYIRMLDFAQRYTDAIDWSDLRAATDILQITNAFSEDKNLILRLPKSAI